MKLGLAALCVASVAAYAEGAAAQGVDEFGPYGGKELRNQRSRQDHALEIRFGRYVPNVDDEFDGRAHPFRDTFGDDTRYLIGFEFDWQLLRIPYFGSLGPGVGFGYTQSSANAPLADGSGKRSDQETSLTVWPMYVAGVVRIDVAARELNIPIVPYGKVGLGYALWSVSSGESRARANGVEGKGVSYGWQYALGGMLQLDFLDQQSAITMDNSTGVNHSYAFVEWYVSRLDAFGGGALQVGDNTWMAGLAFEI